MKYFTLSAFAITSGLCGSSGGGGGGKSMEHVASSSSVAAVTSASKSKSTSTITKSKSITRATATTTALLTVFAVFLGLALGAGGMAGGGIAEITLPAAFAQQPPTATFDFEFALGAPVEHPRGITTLDGKLWVVDTDENDVYVYNSDGTRDAASDFDLTTNNGGPTGITALNGKLWVADGTDDQIYVYNSDGTRDSSSDFTVLSSISLQGITALNGKLWVTDGTDDKIYVYNSNGTRDTSFDFNLDSYGLLAPSGITALNGKIWIAYADLVTLSTAASVRAYNQDGTRDVGSDFDLLSANTGAIGMTALNGKLWVVDDSTDKVYVYDNVPAPLAFDFGLPNDNNNPKGITSFNSKFYVVDNDDNVYGYNSDGTPDDTLDFVLVTDNANSEGITILYDKFYLVDTSDNKVYAYNSTGSQVSALEFGLNSANTSPTGITSLYGQFYVTDNGEDKVYVYDSDGTYDTSFNLQSINGGSQGITTLNGQFYVTDIDDIVYVYDFDGTPKPSLNFGLDSDNTSPRGITSLNGKLWIPDSDDTVYAYNADGTKDVNLNIDLGANNEFASGITALNNKLWVVDEVDDKVYAYNADGTRNSSLDFDLDSDNTDSQGITSLNNKFWVVDLTETFVYAYDSDGAYVSGSSFNLASANDDATGIAALDDKFWVVDKDGVKVYAYNAATGTRNSSSDFGLSTDNNGPTGITSLDGKLWVSDNDGIVYAYNAADGSRVSGSDINLHTDSNNPTGITFLNGKMWVVDNTQYIIYSYNAPVPSDSVSTMSYLWSEDYDAVLNDDGTTTDVSVTFTSTSPFDSNDTYTAKLFITQQGAATIAYSDVQQVTGITPTFSVAHADISLDYEKGIFLIIETYSSEDLALNNLNVVAIKGKDNARTNFPPVITIDMSEFNEGIQYTSFGTSLNYDGTTDVSVFMNAIVPSFGEYTAKLFLHQDSQLVYYDEQDRLGRQLDFNVAHADLTPLDYTKDVTIRIEIPSHFGYVHQVIPAADVLATFPPPDSVAPTLNSVSITSDNTDDSTLAIPGNVVRLSFTSDEPILFSSVDVTINGDRAGISGDGGVNWNAERTIRPADNAGTVTFTIDYSDYSSNAGSTVTGVDTGNTNVSINQVTLPSDQEIELIRSDLAVAASATSAASAVGTIEITRVDTSDFDLDSQNTNPRGITAANDKIYVADLSDDVYVYDPADDGSRVTSLDFELASKNGSPSGMTELDGKFYVVDDVRDKIYVYNSDGTRDNARSDINLNFANEHPTGIAAHEGDLWVVDNDDSIVYVYNTLGSYVATSNFDLDAENSSPQGITSLYGKLWVTDSTDDQVYAYNTDGTRDDTSDFDLGSANSNPRGITASDGMFYVSDDVDHKVYAYSAVIVVRDETSDFDLDADNVSSRGITSINGKLWVVDWTDQKIYAYNTDGGTRDSASDITLDTNNANSNGITALDGKFYVVDSADNKVYVYNTDGTTRDATLDFNLDGANNIQSSGITAYNGKLWITDNSFGAGKIYVYDTDGIIDSDSNFVLDADNINPAGITSINGKLWVLDEIDDKVYVYNPDGTRDSSLDFDLDADNLIPNGITSINGKLWVADVNDDKVYVYNYAKGIEFGIDGLYANTPYKYTTTKCDVTAPFTNAADFDSCSDSVTSEKDSDSTGTLAINVDGPFEDQQQYVYSEVNKKGGGPAAKLSHTDFIVQTQNGAISYFEPTVVVATVDTTPPTLRAVSITSDNADDNTLAIPGNVVTLIFVASENIKTPDVTINGVAADTVAAAVVVGEGVDNAIWITTRTITTTDNPGTVTFTIAYSDLASNAGTPVTGIPTGNTNVAVSQITLPVNSEIELIQDDLDVTIADMITHDANSEFALGSDNRDSTGITTLDGKLWVLGHPNKVHVHHQDGTLDDTSPGFTLHLSNMRPDGITALDSKLWIASSADDQVYVYDTDGTNDSDSNFSLHADNTSPSGITTLDGKFYITDAGTDRVYIYDAATLTSDTPLSEFALDALNAHPQGITALHGKLWVSDISDDKVYVYNPDGTRDADSDFVLLGANGGSTGITYLNGKLWVSDSAADKVFAYDAEGIQFDIDGLYANTSYEYTTTKCDVTEDAGTNVPDFDSCSEFTSQTSSDSTGALSIKVDGPFEDQLQYVFSEVKQIASGGGGAGAKLSHTDFIIQTQNGVISHFEPDVTIPADTTPPTLDTVTIESSNSDQLLATTGDLITLSIAASESIMPPVVTINGMSATIVPGIDDTTWSATRTITTADPDGVVTFTINYSDLADTPNVGDTVTDTTDRSTVTVDKTIITDDTKPTLDTVSITSDNDSYGSLATAGDVVTLRFEASEPILQPVVTINGDSTNNVMLTAIGGDDIIWSATRTITSGDNPGPVTFTITFTDLASNTGDTVTDTTTDGTGVTVYQTALPVNHEIEISPDDLDVFVTAVAAGTVMRDDTFDFDLNITGDTDPSGITVYENKFYVTDTDTSNEKVYAYDAATGTRVPGSDIDLGTAGNEGSQGITVLDNKFYVADAPDDTVYAYNAADGTRVPGSDITLNYPVNNIFPSGIAALNGKLWLVDSSDKVFVYNTDGTRDTSLDFDLDSANTSPSGIVALDGKLWITDHAANKVYVYDAATGTRAASYDFDLHTDNASSAGITYFDGKLWVVDSSDKVFAYNAATKGIQFDIFGLHPDTYYEYSTIMCNVIPGTNVPDLANDNCSENVKRVTSNGEGALVINVDGPFESYHKYVFATVKVPHGDTIYYTDFIVSTDSNNAAISYFEPDVSYVVTAPVSQEIEITQDDISILNLEGVVGGAGIQFSIGGLAAKTSYEYTTSRCSVIQDTSIPDLDNCIHFSSQSTSGSSGLFIVKVGGSFTNSPQYVLAEIKDARTGNLIYYTDFIVQTQGNAVTYFEADVSDAVVVPDPITPPITTTPTATNQEIELSKSDISIIGAGMINFSIGGLVADTHYEYFTTKCDIVTDTAFNDYTNCLDSPTSRVNSDGTGALSINVDGPFENQQKYVFATVKVPNGDTAIYSTDFIVQIENEAISYFEADVQNEPVRLSLLPSENIDAVSGDVIIITPFPDEICSDCDFADGITGDVIALTPVIHTGDPKATISYSQFNSDQSEFVNVLQPKPFSVLDPPSSTSFVVPYYAKTNTLDLLEPTLEATAALGIFYTDKIISEIQISALPADSLGNNGISHNKLVNIQYTHRDGTVVEPPMTTTTTPPVLPPITGPTAINQEIEVSQSDLSVVGGIGARSGSSEFGLTINNKNPQGITFLNNKLYVIDVIDNKVYAYNAADGTRDVNSSFELHTDNTSPSGITALDGKLLVADSTDNKVYIYNVVAGGGTSNTPASNFDLHTDNVNPTGIAAHDGKLWVVDSGDDKVFVYNAGGTRNSSSEFDLTAENETPNGITALDGTIYVTDFADKKVYAYNAANGNRDINSEFVLHLDNANPQGITALENKLWVVDSEDNIVYVYNTTEGIEFGIGGLASDTYYEYSTSRCDVIPGTVVPEKNNCSKSAATRAYSDGAGKLLINVDGPFTEQQQQYVLADVRLPNSADSIYYTDFIVQIQNSAISYFESDVSYYVYVAPSKPTVITTPQNTDHVTVSLLPSGIIDAISGEKVTISAVIETGHSKSTVSYSQHNSDQSVPVDTQLQLRPSSDTLSVTFEIPYYYADEDDANGNNGAPETIIIRATPADPLGNVGTISTKQVNITYTNPDGTAVGTVTVEPPVITPPPPPPPTTDMTKPTLDAVTIKSSNPDGTSQAIPGNTITLTFVSSEPILTPAVTINGVAASSVTGNGGDIVWSATRVITSADDTNGPVTFTIDYSDFAANAGISVSATTDGTGVTVSQASTTADTTKPTLNTVSITSNNSNDITLAKAGNTITLSFTSSEPIETPVVTINGNTADTVVVGAGVGAGDATTWSATRIITSAANDADGPVTFNIAFTDLSTNANVGIPVTVTSDSTSVTVDKMIPTLRTVTMKSSSSDDTSQAMPGDTITLTFISSEPIIDTPTVIINGDTVTATKVINNNILWSATKAIASGDDVDGPVIFNIAFTDMATNVGTPVDATTDGTGVTVSQTSTTITDTTKPTLDTVTMTSNNSNDITLAKAGDTITLSFESSEDIETPVVTINGNAADTVVAVGGDATVWSATRIITSADDVDGPVTFNIAFIDLATNVGISVTGTTDSSGVTVDQMIPTLIAVSIASDNSDTSLATTGDVVTLSFTSSEPIETPDVTISGDGASAIVTGSGDTWSATKTITSGDADGPVTFTINYTDLALNPGSTITGTTNNSAVTVDQTGSSSIPISEIQEENLGVTNTGGIKFSIDGLDASTYYQYTTSKCDVADPDDETCSDFAFAKRTNSNGELVIIMAGPFTNLQYVYAEVKEIGKADPIYRTSFTVQVQGNDIINFESVVSSVIPTEPVIPEPPTLEPPTLDTTAPTLTAVSIVSNNANTSLATTGDTVTLSFTSSEPIQTPTVTINGAAPTTFTGNNDTWSATRTITSADNDDTVVTFTIDYTDLSSNAGAQVTGTTGGTSVTIDQTVTPTPPSTSQEIQEENLGVTNTGGIKFSIGGLDASTYYQYTTSKCDVADPDDETCSDFTFAKRTDSNGILVVIMAGPFTNLQYVFAEVKEIGKADPIYRTSFTVQVQGNDITNFESNVMTTEPVIPEPPTPEPSTPDTIAPTLTAVSIESNNTNDTTLATDGNTVTLSFTSSEPILEPTVTINGDTVTATVLGGDTTTWSAETTIASTDDDGVVAFSITYSDLASNDGGIATSLTAGNPGVTVDNTAPTLTAVSIESDNTDTNLATTDDTITLEFTSSEPIQTPTVTFGGISADTVNESGNTWSATKIITAADADGSAVTFDISFSDLATNAGTSVTSTTDSSVVTVYQTAPDTTDPELNIVSIESNNSDTSRATLGNTVTLSFTSSEPIGTPTVTINTVTATVAPAVAGSTTSWSATKAITAADNDGAVEFTIDFTDLATNGGTQVTSITTGSSVTVDQTAPTLTTVSIESNNTNDTTLATDGNTVTLSFTSDEPILPPTVTINGDTVTATVLGGDTTTWSAETTIASTDDDGVVAFSITYSDLASNDGGIATSPTAGNSDVTVDNTAPTLTAVSIESDNTDTSTATTDDTITLEFTSSEPIQTPTVTFGGISADTVNESGNTWSATKIITAADADGSAVTFDISFSDLATNAGTSVTSTTDSSVVTVYQTAPDTTDPELNIVSIESNNSDTSRATLGNTVTLSFTSSEPIGTPTVTINTVTATVAPAVAGSTTSWSATKAITAADNDGAVEFTIDFTDLATNGGTQVTSITTGSSVTVDQTAPELTAVSIESNNTNDTTLATDGNTITLSFTSDEPILPPTVTINGDTVTATVLGGDTTTWSAETTIASTDADGVVAFSITYSDLASNDGGIATSPTAGNSDVTVDNTAPTLTAVSIESDNTDTSTATTDDTITLEFTSSEPIQTPTVTFGGISADTVNESGNTWSATKIITAADADGSAVTFDISFSDLATNAGTSVTSTTDSSVVTVYQTAPDTTDPELNIVSIESNNSDTSRATLGNTVTLSFTSSEPIGTPTVTINTVTATVAPAVAGSTTSWSATKAITAADNDGAVEFTIDFTDLATNGGTQVTSITTGSSVTVDQTAPELTAVSIESNNTNDTTLATDGNTITLSFTSDEPILPPTVTINGDTVTATVLGGDTTTWSAETTIASTDDDGVVAFSITYSDLASNDGGIATSPTAGNSDVTVDNTAPTLSQVTIKSSSSDSSQAIPGDTIELTIVSSEPINTPTVTINGDTVTATGNNNNTLWSATKAIASGDDVDGPVTFNIAFTDLATNVGTPIAATTDGTDVTVSQTSTTADTTKPTLDTVLLKSSNSDETLAIPGDTVTLSFTSDEPILPPTVTINGDTVTATVLLGTDNTFWVATTVITPEDSPGAVTFEIAFTDLADNDGVPVTAVTGSGTGVTISQTVQYDLAVKGDGIRVKINGVFAERTYHEWSTSHCDVPDGNDCVDGIARGYSKDSGRVVIDIVDDDNNFADQRHVSISVKIPNTEDILYSTDFIVQVVNGEIMHEPDVSGVIPQPGNSGGNSNNNNNNNSDDGDSKTGSPSTITTKPTPSDRLLKNFIAAESDSDVIKQTDTAAIITATEPTTATATATEPTATEPTTTTATATPDTTADTDTTTTTTPDTTADTDTATTAAAAPPSDTTLKNSNDDDDDFKTRPTFGISGQTFTQIVDCGYSMDGVCTDVTEYHVDYNRKIIQTGTAHDFALKAYAQNGMKSFVIGFGVNEVGAPASESEASITVNLGRDYTLDSTYTIDSVEYDNDENVIGENATFAVSGVSCGGGSGGNNNNDNSNGIIQKDQIQCTQLLIDGVLFREAMYDEPFMIEAVDAKRKVITHYMNEGLQVTGESINEPPTHKFSSKKTSQSDAVILELVRTDKLGNIWTDQFGYTWSADMPDEWYYVVGPVPDNSSACDSVDHRACDAFAAKVRWHNGNMESLRDSMYGDVYGAAAAKPFDDLDDAVTFLITPGESRTQFLDENAMMWIRN